MSPTTQSGQHKAGAVPQWVMYLLHKPEDLGSSPSTHIKVWHVLTSTTLALGRPRQEDPQICLASWSSQT